ncbi:MAG TPA: nucleotidyltransferase domain-containing protein [Candidatus Bathyarchaeia archaeon]|nr:nucleotidyltransferase domain-containing protein [Candidatus Bathyarchaeia archaeon]
MQRSISPRRRSRTNSFFLATYSRDRLRQHFENVVKRASEGILKHHPNVLGIAVDGSVGRGDPSPYSDVDMFALVRGGRRPSPVYYLDEGVYVAIGFLPVKDKKEPAVFLLWAKGGAKSVRILYDPKRFLKRLISKRRHAKPGKDSIEQSLLEAYTNLIEYAGKLRNGWLASDNYLTRYAARIIATRSEEVVMVLNNISPITENYLWDLLMKARIRPAHFNTDYPLSIGLRGTSETERVFKSALRLARESIGLVKNRFSGKSKNKSFSGLLKQPLNQIGL